MLVKFLVDAEVEERLYHAGESRGFPDVIAKQLIAEGKVSEVSTAPKASKSKVVESEFIAPKPATKKEK